MSRGGSQTELLTFTSITGIKLCFYGIDKDKYTVNLRDGYGHPDSKLDATILHQLLKRIEHLIKLKRLWQEGT